jgi:predicted dienelactone hydrolase
MRAWLSQALLNEPAQQTCPTNLLNKPAQSAAWKQPALRRRASAAQQGSRSMREEMAKPIRAGTGRGAARVGAGDTRSHYNRPVFLQGLLRMNAPARVALMRCMVGLCLVLAPVLAIAGGATGVGFEPMTFHDPVNGGTTPGYVFYPSAQPSTITWRGPYALDATPDAAPIAGAKPLVVISHGHGGSDLGHHDLATFLASHGFVVATLEHPRDNFHDMSGVGTAAVLDGRPVQLKAAISQLLDDPHWRTFIDPKAIGVAGFSAGGYAALVVAGAVPRFDLYVGYCQRHPKDPDCDLLQKLQAQGTAAAALAELQAGADRWGTPADPRVKAAFVMAPLGLVFDKAGLSGIDSRVFLFYGQDDQVLLPQENVLHIAPLISTLAGLREIPKAGHYVFLAPCSPQLGKSAPELCNDPPGVDRVQAHQAINAAALAFFRKTLGVTATDQRGAH